MLLWCVAEVMFCSFVWEIVLCCVVMCNVCFILLVKVVCCVAICFSVGLSVCLFIALCSLVPESLYSIKESYIFFLSTSLHLSVSRACTVLIWPRVFASLLGKVFLFIALCSSPLFTVRHQEVTYNFSTSLHLSVFMPCTYCVAMARDICFSVGQSACFCSLPCVRVFDSQQGIRKSHMISPPHCILASLWPCTFNPIILMRLSQ